MPMEQIQAKVRSMDSDISEKFIIAAYEDSLIRLFAIKDKTTELLSELSGHSGIATKAVFINQGELIASSDFNGKLILWKLEGNVFVKKAEVAVSNGPIYEIAALYEGNTTTVFCGCENGILNTVKFDAQFKPTVTKEEIHRYGVISVSCNAYFVATGGLDCTVALISKDGIEYIKNHKAAVNAVAVAPTDDENHTIVASCSEDGQLLFTFKDNKKLRTQEITLEEPCYSLGWSKTGIVLTVGYGNDNFKSYIQGESGDYEEVSMTNMQE